MDNIVINTIYLTITDIVIKLNATSRIIPFLEVPLISSFKYRDRNRIKTLVFPDVFPTF